MRIVFDIYKITSFNIFKFSYITCILWVMFAFLFFIVITVLITSICITIRQERPMVIRVKYIHWKNNIYLTHPYWGHSFESAATTAVLSNWLFRLTHRRESRIGSESTQSLFSLYVRYKHFHKNSCPNPMSRPNILLLYIRVSF